MAVTLFTALINFAILLLFLRFLIQLAEIDRHNPAVMTTMKLTSFLDIISRALPVVAKGRANLAALVVIILLYLVKFAVLAKISDQVQIYSVEHLVILTFVSAIQGVLSFIHYLIIAAILLSWVVLILQKPSPIIDLIQALAEPILAPIRKVLPNMGMIDLSPLVAILAIIILETLMNAVAKTLLAGF